jgi:AcrR family transcriptional regulator
MMDTERDTIKRTQLIETGKRLFWKYGFRRVSVEEICREADVSKMTFYRYFENKTELAKTIFSSEVRKGIEKFNSVMEADIPPPDKLKAIITLKAEGTHDISREFLMDFYRSNDTGLKDFVEKTTAEAWKEIIEGFRMAQEKGWFRKDFKPEFMMFVTEHLIPLLTDEKLLELYDSPGDLLIEAVNFFTYGIAPHS